MKVLTLTALQHVLDKIFSYKITSYYYSFSILCQILEVYCIFILVTG